MQVDKQNLWTGWEIIDLLVFVGVCTLFGLINSINALILNPFNTNFYNAILGLSVTLAIIYIFLKEIIWVFQFSAKLSYSLGLISNEIYEKSKW